MLNLHVRTHHTNRGVLSADLSSAGGEYTGEECPGECLRIGGVREEILHPLARGRHFFRRPGFGSCDVRITGRQQFRIIALLLFNPQIKRRIVMELNVIAP